MATRNKDADAGQAEAQQKVETAEEQGYLGVKVDPRPNSDYSLQSGPDSPTALESRADTLRTEADAVTNPDATSAPKEK